MTLCDRCYQPLEHGEHGLYVCPLEARRRAPVVRPDSIPGGLWIFHGLCNPDGTPRRYDSQTEIDKACAERGLTKWTDVYTEDRTKDWRVQADWMRSREAKRERAGRGEMRRDQQMKRGTIQ